MAQHMVIKSWLGIGVNGDRDRYVHLVASVLGYPEWVVDVTAVLTPNGSFGLSDLRVCPAIHDVNDREPADASEVPIGGIPARLLRAINAGELLDHAQRAAGAFAKRPLVGDWRKDEFTTAGAALARAERHRAGRKGNGLDYYLDWALRYAQKVEAGSRHPIAELAAEDSVSQSFVRDTVHDARQRYRLLTKPGRGRAGGTLSPQAIELLNNRKEQTDGYPPA